MKQARTRTSSSRTSILTYLLTGSGATAKTDRQHCTQSTLHYTPNAALPVYTGNIRDIVAEMGAIYANSFAIVQHAHVCLHSLSVMKRRPVDNLSHQSVKPHVSINEVACYRTPRGH